MSSYDNYIISKEDAILIDKLTIEQKFIPSVILMEEASEKIYNQLIRDFKDITFYKIAFIAGWGNNGGDCLSLARRFINDDILPDIFIFKDHKGSELYEMHKKIIAQYNIKIFDIFELKEKINDYSLIIDGVFGIGYKDRDDEMINNLFNIINEASAVRASIDIPSGLGGKFCIKADYTYSVGFLKKDFYDLSLREFCGKITNLKISFDIKIIGKKEHAFRLDNNYHLKKFTNNFVHKYKRGACLLIGGSKGKFGSIIMSGESAYSCGSGIVLILTENENIIPMNMLSKNIIFDSYDNCSDYIDKYDTILIGPGLDFNDINNNKLILNLLKKDKQFIFDASFFSIYKPADIINLKRNCILTPHTRELINFFKDEASNIKSDTISVLKNISLKYGCFILLKDCVMILSCPDGQSFVFDNPCRILAQAGSGDILAGIITSILSQGYGCIDSIIEGIRLFFEASKRMNSAYSYSSDSFIDSVRFIFNED